MMEWQHWISEVFSSDSPLSRAGLVGGAVCAAWVGGLGVWAGRRLLGRRRARVRFLAAAAERGFTAADALCLWELSRFSSDREQVLTSLEALDRCIAAARATADDDPLGLPEYLTETQVAILRRKFLPSRRAAHNIVHTRQIERNQPVRVRLADGAAFNAFVVESTPGELELTVPAGGLGLRMERSRAVHVTFWRALDARYEFDAEVTGGGTSGRRLTVAHAPVRRFQQREHVRVRCRDAVRLAFIDAETARDVEAMPVPPALTATGNLRDLSVGGACLVTPAQPPEGCWVLMRLGIKRDPWSLLLPARVIRRQTLNGASTPLTQLCVKFEPLTARAEYQLSRFVADIEQELIRRMLARAGEETAAEAPDAGAAPKQRPPAMRRMRTPEERLPAPAEPADLVTASKE